MTRARLPPLWFRFSGNANWHPSATWVLRQPCLYCDGGNAGELAHAGLLTILLLGMPDAGSGNLPLLHMGTYAHSQVSNPLGGGFQPAAYMYTLLTGPLQAGSPQGSATARAPPYQNTFVHPPSSWDPAPASVPTLVNGGSSLGDG